MKKNLEKSELVVSELVVGSGEQDMKATIRSVWLSKILTV